MRREKGPRGGPPEPNRRPERRLRALAWAAGSMGRPRWGSFGVSGPESKSAGVNGPARGSLRAGQRGAPSEADAPVGLGGADVQSVSRGRSCRPQTYPRAGTTWLLVLRGPGSASRAASLRGCALARCGTGRDGAELSDPLSDGNHVLNTDQAATNRHRVCVKC